MLNDAFIPPKGHKPEKDNAKYKVLAQQFTRLRRGYLDLELKDMGNLKDQPMPEIFTISTHYSVRENTSKAPNHYLGVLG